MFDAYPHPLLPCRFARSDADPPSALLSQPSTMHLAGPREVGWALTSSVVMSLSMTQPLLGAAAEY